MTVLVTGAGGQVGHALCQALVAAGRPVRALQRAALDITDVAALRRAVHGADSVVNLAAYTAVDRAEAEPRIADRVNRLGAGLVARVAADAGLPLVHLSTDFVFGTAGPQRPLCEDDPTGPVNVYGATKLAGEGAVLDAHRQAVILRCAWIFSDRGRNFVQTILGLAATRKELRVVADQWGSPTAAADIADAILAVLSAPDGGRDGGGPKRAGVYHFAGTPPASWHDLAVAAVAAAGLACSVTPITTADWPTAARRPAWSVLDSSRFATRFGLPAPDWRPALGRVVARAPPAAAGAEAGGWR